MPRVGVSTLSVYISSEDMSDRSTWKNPTYSEDPVSLDTAVSQETDLVCEVKCVFQVRGLNGIIEAAKVPNFRSRLR